MCFIICGLEMFIKTVDFTNDKPIICYYVDYETNEFQVIR